MRPKKRFGQHFLTATHIAERIAASVPALPGEHVLEIGPGRGALSVHLIKRFPRLHLVELDSDMISALKEKLRPGQWTLHQADIRDFDFARVGFPLHLVGNLPYFAAAAVIHKTLCSNPKVASCTFMVQREVAQRILAQPGSRCRGYLSVLCQFFGAPTIVAHAPAGAFFPKPKVDSTVFQIVITPQAQQLLPWEQQSGFFAMVDVAFRQRRKILANALSSAGGDKAQWIRSIRRAGLDPQSRPEDIEMSGWVSLFMERPSPCAGA